MSDYQPTLTLLDHEPYSIYYYLSILLSGWARKCNLDKYNI